MPNFLFKNCNDVTRKPTVHLINIIWLENTFDTNCIFIYLLPNLNPTQQLFEYLTGGCEILIYYHLSSEII